MNDITAIQPALSKVAPGQPITAEHVIEGAANLLEAGIQMELLARYWLHLHGLGWTLAHPVKNGASTLVEPEGWNVQ